MSNKRVTFRLSEKDYATLLNLNEEWDTNLSETLRRILFIYRKDASSNTDRNN